MTDHTPFCGTVHHGDKGLNVEVYKRAIKEWDAKTQGGRWYQHPGTIEFFGPWFVEPVKIFQAQHGLPASGWIGPKTHRNLVYWIDDYGARLLRKLWHRLHPPADPRTHLIQSMDWYAHTYPNLPYVEQRPYACPPFADDCSSFYTCVYYRAKLADPNGSGFNYDGYGNTDTLLANGKPINYGDLEPGDAVLYSNPGHVAIVRERKFSSVLGWSHGSPGILYLSLAGTGQYRQPTAYRSFVA